MKALLALLADRRRSQSGSVLSAVLIITAFLAIIAGALGTEISTNFLLSRALVNRVSTEATVNSAAELAINQLQGTPINASCPSLTPAQVNLNSQTAVVNYVSCAPVVYWRERQFVPFLGSSQFRVDGTIAQLFGRKDYVVADAGGSVYDFRYGNSSPRWAFGLGGNVTGPPLVMPDGSSNISTLVPVSGPNNNPGVSPDCGPADECVALLSEDLQGGTALQCFLDAGAPVTAQPAAGKAFPMLAYFGDANGNLFAYQATENGNCAQSATVRVAGGQAVVAGPVVWQNGGSDEIFIVTAGGGSSQFLHYTYSQGGRGPRLTLSDQISLPAANPVGLALEQTTLPARLAITFASGTVAIVRVDTAFDPNVIHTAGVGSGVRGAPYWCTVCSGGTIGVGGANGTLYVLNPNLNIVASYAGGSAISTTPTADLAGDWYFAADDGQLYEVQLPPSGTAMVLAAHFGTASARIGSSPVLGSCPAGICVYLGSLDANAYLISLDARDAVMTACINSCAGTGPNPRLWTHVQVGVAGNSQTVHVQGWSYYSP